MAIGDMLQVDVSASYATQECGKSIDVHGDTVAIGDPAYDSRRGQVFIYIRDSIVGPMSYQATIVPSTQEVNSDFGFSVAVYGNWLFVGNPHKDNSGTDRGSVWVFKRTGTSWSEVQEISGTVTGAYLGWDLATNGTHLVAGAPERVALGSGATNGGRVYTYTESGGMWIAEDDFNGTGVADEHQFGCSVSISGTSIAVGARGGNINYSGAAYVFTGSGGVWTEQQKIISSRVGNLAHFGHCVHILSDRMAIGEQGSTYYANPGGGRAEVHTRSAGVWTQEQELGASDAGRDNHFGERLALAPDGVTLYVSAPGLDAAPSNGGGLYKFDLSAGVWSEDDIKRWSPTANADRFGSDVAVDEDVSVTTELFMAIGAYGAGTGGAGAFGVIISMGPITLDKALISKDGGEDLTISGSLGTGVEYLAYIGPLATASDESCYGGTSGNGYRCYSLDGATLQIVTPPLSSTGQMTVTLCDSSDSILAQSTIEVVERSLSSEMYEARTRWPDWYQTGPRDIGNLEDN
jgi:hypothetical protein